MKPVLKSNDFIIVGNYTIAKREIHSFGANVAKSYYDEVIKTEDGRQFKERKFSDLHAVLQIYYHNGKDGLAVITIKDESDEDIANLYVDVLEQVMNIHSFDTSYRERLVKQTLKSIQQAYNSKKQSQSYQQTASLRR
jgi:hypothetical protein